MRPLTTVVALLLTATTLTAQAPSRVSDVAQLLYTNTESGSSYPVFGYEGLRVIGDLSLQDYRAAIALVKPQLGERESIIEVIASQQVPGMRANGKDVIVQTCQVDCEEDAFNDNGAGRVFVLERIGDDLRLHAVGRWVA